jgi:hypothetical protein
MKNYTYLILNIATLFIGVNCSLAQEKKTWIKHSKDSIISVKHYYDGASQQLDSLVFKYHNKSIPLTKDKTYIHEEDTILKYKDALSMPFDVSIPTITQIINLSASTYIAVGFNMGVEKLFANYMNIIIIDKPSREIRQWITSLVPRGEFIPVFLVNELSKTIVLLKNENHILEEKIYTLHHKTKQYKEISLNKHFKYINNKTKNNQQVFTVEY